MVAEVAVSRRRTRIEDQAARHRLLADPTRLLIVEALADGPRLITELVAITGVHRNTVRAHLARLEAAGMLERAPVAPAGKGRPADLYRLRETLTPSGTEQRLLIQALLRLVTRAYEEGAVGMAEQEGERIGRELATVVSFPTIEQALVQVTSVLRRLAFSPQLSRSKGVARIALRSCPFAVQPDDPRGGVVCAFHHGLIRGVVAVAAPPGHHDVRLLPHVSSEICRAEIEFG